MNFLCALQGVGRFSLTGTPSNSAAFTPSNAPAYSHLATNHCCILSKLLRASTWRRAALLGRGKTMPHPLKRLPFPAWRLSGSLLPRHLSGQTTMFSAWRVARRAVWAHNVRQAVLGRQQSLPCSQTEQVAGARSASAPDLLPRTALPPLSRTTHTTRAPPPHTSHCCYILSTLEELGRAERGA